MGHACHAGARCSVPHVGPRTLPYEQVWKKVISLLERLVVLCGDDEMSGAEFTDILTEGLEELHFTLITPTADHVKVTAMERGK